MISGLVFSTVILLVVTNLATGSLNPVEVFRQDNLFLKIVAGFLIFSMTMGVLKIIMNIVLGDKLCPSDSCGGKSLPRFEQAYGPATRCSHCGRWFHKKCLLSKGGGLLEGCKHTGCSTYVGDYHARYS
jgi:hypothetical protein